MICERFTIPMLAEGLNVLPETIRSAAGRARLERSGEWYLLPADSKNPLRLLFFRLLASRPQNVAEQLRHDLGIRSPRR